MIDIFDGQIIFDNDQLESLVQKRMVTVNGIELIEYIGWEPVE